MHVMRCLGSGGAIHRMKDIPIGWENPTFVVGCSSYVPFENGEGIDGDCFDEPNPVNYR